MADRQEALWLQLEAATSKLVPVEGSERLQPARVPAPRKLFSCHCKMHTRLRLAVRGLLGCVHRFQCSRIRIEPAGTYEPTSGDQRIRSVGLMRNQKKRPCACKELQTT